MRARTLLLTLAVVCLLPAGTAAAASSKFTIRGAGFGHGVGMSQYGAYGFALNGSGYRDILGHYYTGTAIGSFDPNQRVRVLLQSVRGSASFTGAVRAGRRRLSSRKTYYVRRRGPAVQLLSARRKKMGTYSALRVTGRGGVVTLRGRAANGRVNGAYRGAIDFSPGAFSGVDAINALSLDTYLRGVVPDESPPSWPLEALKAQAVAARTYAIATMKPGAGFDVYPDTRSQVYGGVAAEEPSTDQAIAETRGEVVTYEGAPVVTYFFSTSGGRTEDVENTPLGNEPRPWLKSVDDPYDDTSPRHRWGPIRMTLKQAGRKLGGLVKGRFRGIEVVRRGRSPRIVEADVIGSRGRVRTTGGTLRARLGLFDTWAFFTSITTGEEPPPVEEPAGPPTGGTEPFGSAAWLRARTVGRLTGRVLPVLKSGELTVQRRERATWVEAGKARVRRGGRYAYDVTVPGVYRVRYHDENGPAVRVRCLCSPAE
jgi:stage II sporulation protein D